MSHPQTVYSSKSLENKRVLSAAIPYPRALEYLEEKSGRGWPSLVALSKCSHGCRCDSLAQVPLGCVMLMDRAG